MRPLRIAVAIACGAVALTAIAAYAGVRINTTESMPRGLWLSHPYAGVARPGEAVAACLPPTEQTRRYIGPGTCPNGMEPLLKTVGAVPGDTVTVAPSTITINGRSIAGTAALARDAAGRTLTAYPSGTYQVQPGQVWLISTYSARSYDSRYFGPVNASAIVAIGEPLWTE